MEDLHKKIDKYVSVNVVLRRFLKLSIWTDQNFEPIY